MVAAELAIGANVTGGMRERTVSSSSLSFLTTTVRPSTSPIERSFDSVNKLSNAAGPSIAVNTQKSGR